MEKTTENGKTDMEEKLKKRLLALTWDELRDWSDARSVERGRGYLSRVEPPVLFPDGGLVAEVHGSDDYFAKLRVDASDRLEGVCTCPVGVRCKHCVALALAAAKRLKAGGDFPEADLASRRWKRAAEDLEDPDDDFDCEDILDDEWEDEVSDDKRDTAASASAGSADGRAADARKRADIVADHLSSLDETELRALADELLAACPDVRPYLKHKLEMARASTADLVRRARQAIKDATYGYYDHWDRRYGHDEVPDYSLVKEYFGRIRDAGDVHALMELGDLLKRRANEQEERSNDEDGEIGDQVAACMDIVAAAVMASDMDVRAKIKWENAIHAGDDFCMLDGMEVSYRTALTEDKKTWGIIADDLMKRAPGDDASDWKSRADRTRLCEALERTGRAEEAVAYLKKAVADDAGACVELADLLCRLNRRAEAEDECRKGLVARVKATDTYGVNVIIRRKLRELLVLDKDWKAVAASDLDDYLSSPYIGTYKTLKASCEKARCWPRVRSFVLSFLETGCAAAGTKADWPLPKTGVPLPKAAKPNLAALLEIALEEKRGKDAWSLYEQLRREANGAAGGYGYAYDDFGWRVADAVAKELPEESLKIWDGQIRAHVASAHESCYQTICRALEKMRPVMVRLGKGDDWKARVAGLRTEYKRRPKFVAMLDALTSGRGASSRIADW